MRGVELKALGDEVVAHKHLQRPRLRKEAHLQAGRGGGGTRHCLRGEGMAGTTASAVQHGGQSNAGCSGQGAAKA